MNPSSSDLAERFARTQGETKCILHGGYLLRGLVSVVYDSPMCPCRIPGIDVSILPIIWADCKAKGWHWTMKTYEKYDGTIIYTAILYYAPGLGQFWNDDDPVAALCEAYCKAVESAR